jgi:3-oxoacyl-[acyl-carrier protein] reductase
MTTHTHQTAPTQFVDAKGIHFAYRRFGKAAGVPLVFNMHFTKGAVKMFAQALSREVGSRGITVNNVQPGPIDTDLNPAAGDWAVPQKAATALDRYGHVDEVAALVAFVAGPESSYITGANLTVDGGMNA